MRRALAAALLLAGCGKGPAKLEGGGAPRKDAVTIVYRHGAVRGFERYFYHLFSEFSKTHPHIVVKSEVLPTNTDQQHQLYAINLEGGSDAFDVMGLDIIWIAEFARAGWALDLSPYFTREERAPFLPSTVEAATFGGGVYGVPFFTDSGLLYYRKDLLEKYGHKPPETWDDLVRISKDVLAKENDKRLVGYVWQGKQYEGMVCGAIEVLASNGVRFLDEKGRWAVDREKAVESLRMMRDLMQVHRVSPMLVLAADEETTRQIFGNGEAVFMRNWPYALGIYNKEDSLVRGKVGVAPLPHFAGGRSAGTLGGWYYGINKSSKHPKEAYEFIRYMASEAVQKDLFVKLGYLPTRTKLYTDPEMLLASPHLPQFGEILKRTVPRPVTPYYSGLSDVLQAEFSGVLAGLKTPEDALRNIQIQVEPVLAR